MSKEKYEVVTVATETAEQIIDKDKNPVSERSLLVEISNKLDEILKVIK